MTWETFSIGGVSPREASINDFSVEAIPNRDVQESITSAGTTRRRTHWYKQTLRLSGSGNEPLYLPGLDYTASMTLTLRRYTAADVWSDVNYTVLARPPVISDDMIGAEHSWAMECIEVDATVLHSLPHVFSLGGVTPHALAQLEFSQALSPLVGGSILRMGSGAGQIREHWRKTEILLSGSGWVPLNGLDALDYSTAKTLTISTLASIDGSGDPVYSNQNYSVATQGPQHSWDMVGRLYRWSLQCEEV